ncbi:MAG: hypothetical protein LBU81_07485 [Methanosarcinales archaeon]|jgi:hypothetical protein|nr:hypothetical protein [Methanosarcinales archaeon]
MPIYTQFQNLQNEFEKYKDSDAGKPSFFCFVEHCGKVKNASEKFFEDLSEREASEIPADGKNRLTARLIRNAARKRMAEQKLAAKASEPPISKAWTADGISETILRIKKMEQTAAAKTENLTKTETMIMTTMTVGNYRSIKKAVVESLREKMKNPKASVESYIPVKYRVLIGKEDLRTADMILNFIAPDMKEPEADELENMNYVGFKYTVLTLMTALRLTYEFPPNYEIYRFCAALPKNPSGNSGLILKLEDIISFTGSKMSDIVKLAKIYDKYEQYEIKVLGGND